ncbi:DinB family protein [Mucilaginibacter sp. Bleaf8]|uniref:DinB family protein n=1 Tax=Mucilaginibacter sp. Bleaf8 TaxID=2834430 RepID=UPI001BCCC9DF|nr:DinB family protein [Mucilaginibacter sp. Bleaf8]MBS7565615.1 DinB family protein [Mucilaginibacter sp. Bleaf8]
MITPPQPDEYASFYANYVKLATERGDVLKTLSGLKDSTHKLLSQIPQEMEDYAYADRKWTIKQLVSHMIDAERIFAYRLLCISRQDGTNLPGFDEEEYVVNANVNERTLKSLADEFKAVREANLYLCNAIPSSRLSFKGLANNSPVSVRALLYIMAGHELHHLNILREKYL